MKSSSKMKNGMRLIVVACAVLAVAAVACGCASLLERTAGAPAGQQNNVERTVSPQFSYEADGAGMVADTYAGEEFDDGSVGFNTEEYAAIREGGFVSAATRPLSTLSADVDTASYCNLRRILSRGRYAGGVPAGAVRIEEMLNYFAYDYALPTGSDLFGTTVQVAECPWNPDTKLLVMGFATSPEAIEERTGSNLVFLVDVSSSMDSSDKLGLLQDAFGELVDKLGPNDTVSIVTYANGEEVVLDGVKGDDKRTIMRAINALRADGATNGEAGLLMAYDVARNNFIEGGVNRIILASDGDLNVGMTSESSLEAYVSKQRDTGIYLSVLGFGEGNYKDTKMETIADNGNGQYHYIDCVAEAERVFGENLTANLLPLADDVKLQVEFNPAMVKGYRLIGYENRALADEDFRNDAVDAGDVGPGHQFTVAYEIALADSDQEVVTTDLKYSGETEAVSGGEGEWLTCTMRYRLAEDGSVHEQSFVVDEHALTDDPSGDWRFAAAVIEAGMVLRGSEYANGIGFDDVEALLDRNEPEPLRQEFAGLVDLAGQMEYPIYESGDTRDGIW